MKEHGYLSYIWFDLKLQVAISVGGASVNTGGMAVISNFAKFIYFLFTS